MAKMKKRYYWLLIICIVALTVYYVTESLDLSVLTNLTAGNIIILLFLSILPLFVFVYALKILLKGLGYKSSLKSLYLIATSSLAANYTTPVKIGIPLRVYLYKKILGIPLSRGTASLAIEIFLETLLPALISILAIATLFKEYSVKIPLVGMFLLFVIFYTAIFLEPLKLKKVTSKLPFHNKLDRLLEFGIHFQEGVRLMDKNVIVPFSLLLLVMYAIGALRLYVILFIFGFEMNPLHLLYVNMISFTIGSISMVPLGLGTRDASIVLLLLELGVPNEVAIPAALIQRVLGTGLNFVLGAVSASALGIKFFEFRKVESEGQSTDKI